ncbi:histidine kinase/DNA gyrase B/HSP90-like ATPase [Ancylomarina subtilis]|uniref:histidine kinase n=1 Tax=Ancylomarina subtilis TaxID=1639035 RepID=A0A4Q7VJ77_9BACT|nr:ATP-binding protein [Ancylomarina subtilis]RZT96241.1 histidine kinase/DNA gyrase B/HSP90-like ATPase [Ancylomarina subtilis]
MIYKKLFVRLILKLSLIVLLSVSMGWLLWVSVYPLLALAPMALILYLFYRMLHDLNSTNRLLSQFFLAVKNDETALNLQHYGEGKSFDALRESMQGVNQIIKDLRMKYQQKEIVSDAIIENAAVGILTFNSQGMVEGINRKGRELLGVHHLVSIKALLKTDPNLVELFQRIKAGESRVLKTQVKQRTLHLLVSCTCIKLGNENWKLLSFTDIKSEMDATELESWQRLISVLTHEIMNSIAPLTSLSETLVQTYSQIDAESVIGEKNLSKTRLGLQVIQEQGEGLMHFVDNYRQLTRIPKPQLKRVSLKHLFEHVKALLALDDDTKIDYHFSIEEDDLLIEADEKLMVQVLVNLIQNAQHAITDRGILQVLASRANEGNTLIKIIDNGVGIKADDIKNIFVPFFTTRENGSGIGLSITRQIMRLHQAKISLESVYGEGCKVELNFPSYN